MKTIVFLFFLGLVFPPSILWAEEKKISVSGTPFHDLNPSRPEQKSFGPLTFKGGAYLNSEVRDFGGFSALHILDGGKKLLAVADSGSWLKADIKRDQKGAIIGLENAKMGPLYSGKGPRKNAPKYYVDAEALVVSKGQAFVAYEAINEIARYKLDQRDAFLKPELLELPNDVDKATVNKGLEALALAPQSGRLSGYLVAITERGANRRDASFGWIIKPNGSSEKEGLFRVERDNLFDVTDAVFLKNGNLMLLERRFTIADGVAMRLRKIDGNAIKKGARLKGEVIMQADFSYRIDNMEGISLYENEKGEQVLALLSDDNHSLLQRTILMEFVLDKE